MGLKITYGAFDGGYIRFNFFRRNIIECIGGSWSPHKNQKLDNDRWYWRTDGESDEEYNRKNYEGLYQLLCHDDDEGEISLEHVKLLKRDLEKIFPLVKERGDNNFIEQVEQFISGCKDAIKNNDKLEFL